MDTDILLPLYQHSVKPWCNVQRVFFLLVSQSTILYRISLNGFINRAEVWKELDWYTPLSFHDMMAGNFSVGTFFSHHGLSRHISNWTRHIFWKYEVHFCCAIVFFIYISPDVMHGQNHVVVWRIFMAWSPQMTFIRNMLDIINLSIYGILST